MYYLQISRPDYGRAYDDYRDACDVKCSRNGKCTVTYYDRRYDDRDYRCDDRRW